MTPIREREPPAPLLPHESPARTALARAPPPDPAEGPSPFARLVRGLARETDAGEAVVHGVLHAGGGAALDSMSLLALQAGVYRYGETLDLAARLVDKASSSVKTVVQGGQ